MASLILAVVLDNEMIFMPSREKPKEVAAIRTKRATSLEQRVDLFTRWLDARSLVEGEWEKLRVVCVGRSFSASDKNLDKADMETDAELIARSIKAKIADKPYAEKFEILEEKHSATRVEQAVFFFYKLKDIIKEYRDSEEGKSAPKTITIELNVFTSYLHMAETYYIFWKVYYILKEAKDEHILFVNIPVFADKYNLYETSNAELKSFSNKKLLTNRVIYSKEVDLNLINSKFAIKSTTFEKIRLETKPVEIKKPEEVKPEDPKPEGDTQEEEGPSPLSGKELAAMTGFFSFFDKDVILLTLSSDKIQESAQSYLTFINSKTTFLKFRGMAPEGNDTFLKFVTSVIDKLFYAMKNQTIPILI